MYRTVLAPVLLVAALIPPSGCQLTASEHKKAADGRTDAEIIRLRVPHEVFIVGGELSQGFPSVGALVNEGLTICTGTLVGCRTVLTASHCFDGDESPDSFQVFFQHAGFVGVDSISPKHELYERFGEPHADLAVLRLSRQVDGLPVTDINETFVVPNGTEGTNVGFGITLGDRSDSGLKRQGTVMIAECDHSALMEAYNRRVDHTTLLCWDFTEGFSNSCNGDSGGPMFVADPNSPLGNVLLAGTTVWGKDELCRLGDHSWDVDVRQFSPWIATQAMGNVGETQCGPRPEIGETNVKVIPWSHALGPRQIQDFLLDVPHNTASLLVTLNGTNAPRSNLNLYLKWAAAASPADNDCADVREGNYAACEIAAPHSGQWFIRVREDGGGESEFQLTVTLFPKTSLE